MLAYSTRYVRRGGLDGLGVTAIGLSREEVRGSLRFSLSQYTTREEIDYAVSVLSEIVARLREMSPDEDALRIESSSISL